jgi:hypothetical protein
MQFKPSEVERFRSFVVFGNLSEGCLNLITDL